jgi:glycosyltransferase involved in cell wall biosynthesis
MIANRREGMNIYFISPFCLLRPTTNRIFDVRFCDLIAGTGAKVTLIHPYYFMKDNIKQSDINTCYGVVNEINFKMLRTPLSESSPRWWQRLVVLLSVFWVSVRIIYSNRRDLKNVYVNSRDNKSLLPMLLLKKILQKWCSLKIIHTVHEIKKGDLNSWMYKDYDGLFVTTLSAKNDLVQKYAIPESKIDRLISPVTQVNYSCDKVEAREKIHYTSSTPLVVYTGKLGKGIKEVGYMLDAAASLPEYNFILTGGKPEIVDWLKEICKGRDIKNILFTGFLNDSTIISYYQLAADVLISYYTMQDHIVEYNFPQKLVEYMFTRNPIVTPDFAATHDLINASNAIVVEPDNIHSFVAGIKMAIEDRESSQFLAKKAFEDVSHFSFEKGGVQVLNFFKTL